MTTHIPYPEEVIDHELERAARKVLMADDKKLLDRYRGALKKKPEDQAKDLTIAMFLRELSSRLRVFDAVLNSQLDFTDEPGPCKCRIRIGARKDASRQTNEIQIR